jgi:hypothetical protein
MDEMFYILSLKWSRKRDDLLMWWAPGENGYVFRIDGTRKPAGKYTREDVERRRSYLNNGTNTMAVPCAFAEAASIALSESDSCSIDMVDTIDRVVPFGQLAAMKQASREAFATKGDSQ